MTVTMALFILTFDNTMKIIKFKNIYIYNDIKLGHLKSHFEVHRGERIKAN